MNSSVVQEPQGAEVLQARTIGDVQKDISRVQAAIESSREQFRNASAAARASSEQPGVNLGALGQTAMGQKLRELTQKLENLQQELLRLQSEAVIEPSMS